MSASLAGSSSIVFAQRLAAKSAIPRKFATLIVIGKLPVGFEVPDSKPALDKVTPEGRVPVLVKVGRG